MDISGIGKTVQQSALDALQNTADATAPAAAPAAAPVAAPADDDVVSFEAAMAGNSTDVTRIDLTSGPVADTVLPSDAPVASSGRQTVGDRILAGMSSISETVQSARGEVVQTLDKAQPTQADLLKAQFVMMESNTIVSAVSKTTEKLTSAVKTLQQG